MNLRTLLSGLLFFASIGLQAQNQKQTIFNNIMSIEFEENLVSHDVFFQNNKDLMGITDHDELVEIQTITGHNGFMHYRYKQLHNQIPVLGTNYVLHEKNKYVVSAHGSFLPKIDINTTPNYEQAQAVERAEAHLFGLVKKEAPQQEVELLEDQTKTSLVIVDRNYPDFSGSYKLAYKMEVKTKNPYRKYLYLIDAKSGEMLFHNSMLMHEAVPAKGPTFHYGEKSFTVDSISPDHFEMRDPTRNNNSVFDDAGNVFTDDDNYWDLINEQLHQTANDAHWCTSTMHDMLVDDFNWNGLDNVGFPMNCRVAIFGGGSYLNAFWDGEVTSYGNGDCHNGPLTTLEVIGHEFMHGITQFTSGLVYNEQSGAINESLSDVMGKILEYNVDPDNFNWYIGGSFKLNDKTEPFRHMANPTEEPYRDPAALHGQYWRDGGGVHTNSSVGNLWFHYLVEGGTGTNEFGTDFNVQGIGMDKAGQIAFTTATTYLWERSDYNHYFASSVKAAEEIYGEGSNEVTQVIEAWKAVNVPDDGYGTYGGLDLSVAPVDESFIISECYDNAYYPIEVYIHNRGTVDYEVSMEANLSIESNFFPDDMRLIDQDIPVGDSLLMVFNDLLFIDDDRDYTVNFQIAIVDFNANNNRDRLYVSNSLIQEPDILPRVNIRESDCSDTRSRVSVSLSNIGCTLPAGSPMIMYILDETGTQVWNREVTLDEPYGQNSTRFYFADFNPPTEPGVTYRMVLDNDLDVNPANNSVEFQPYTIQEITEEYLNEFGSDQSLNDKIGLSSMLLQFFSLSPIYDFQGESVLASSGFSQTGNAPLCLDQDDNFDNNQGGGETTNIRMCADVTGIVNPTLGFDLLQFQNENQEFYDEIKDFVTMVRVSYEDDFTGSTFSEIISAQEEGVWINHQYPLPDGFIGTITIDLFNLTGIPVDEPQFLDFDVNLLDNLEIYGEPLSTADLIDTELNMFPNPTTGEIIIQHDSTPESITIYNASGQVLMQTAGFNSNETKINVSHLEDSYYLIKATYKDARVVVDKLIKITD